MRHLILIALLSFNVTAAANVELKSELEQMARADQAIRKKIGEIGWENPPEALLDKMRKIDAANTLRLKEIVAKNSWVSAKQVGNSGVSAAFLIIQHSADHEFQAQMLPLLKQSYLAGEGVTGQEFALLTDRVLIHQNKKQRYGTQLSIVDGQLVFDPISDEQNVDSRRAKLGMTTLEEYKKLLTELYKMQVR